jgi:class 3 adenylate cyclase
VPETRDYAVAFADIASSALIYRQLGDAAASELTQAFCAQVGALLPRYKGRLVKTLGDEVMCAFPYPDQAVRAMAALHGEMANTPPGSHPVRLHTGINFGPVIVDRDDFFGTTVNVAAYLAGIARAEQILTTEAVVSRLSPATVSGARALYTTRFKGDESDSLIYEVIWQVDPGEVTGRNPGSLRQMPADEGALLVSTAELTVSVDRSRARIVLGRDADNDVVVNDQFASRRHATVELDAIRFRLIDHSANGTFVIFDGSSEEVQLLRGEAMLHGSGRISLGRSFSDPLATTIIFRRDQRALYRV